MEESYKQFVDKLNTYIRKFYFYQVVRGILLFILLSVLYFSFISLLEYSNYFDPGLKLIILIFTLFFIFFICCFFIFLPLVKLVGLGKRLTYIDISSHLSSSFPEIGDKLINIIELNSEKDTFYSNELKRASIDQKIEDLKIYNFADSIRFRDLKFVFIIFCSVLFFVLLTFVKFPELYRESSVRLIHFKQKFEKPAPYFFKLDNSKLTFISGESVELKLHCLGKNLPEIMYVNIGGNIFLMQKKGDYFFYKIENLNSSIALFFTDKKFISDYYKLTVINKPFVSSFDVEIHPPGYTNLPAEKIQNIGDFKVVRGTNLKWIFNTSDADSLYLIFSDSTRVAGYKNNGFFEVSKTVYSDFGYKILVKNNCIKNQSSLIYTIQLINDLFPEIKVIRVQDSTDFKVFHFKGNIIDDFGFHQLGLSVSSEKRDTLFSVPFLPFLLNQDFYYSFDFESVKSLGKSFKYHFFVCDNDVINHFKKSVSETFSFSFPDYVDIVAKENFDQGSLEQLFNKSNKLTEEIQQDLKEFKLKQINSQVSDWEKFQTVKDIMNKKTELQTVLEQIKQQNNNANNYLKSFSEEKSDVLKKQKQIDELLNDIMTDDLKKLFEEFSKLSNQFDLSKFEQLSKGMDNRLNDLSKQLEKNLQLLKKMKIEQKVQRIVDGLKKVSDDERDIFKSIENKKDLISISTEEKNNQTIIDVFFNEYKSILSLNNELDKPMKLFDFTREFNDIKLNYSRVLENIAESNKRRTKLEIDKNANDLQQLSFAMHQMMNSIDIKQRLENIEDLKQILNNLILVSFDQESLLTKYGNIDFNNPLINDLRIKQKVINNQITFVKDSLYALAKRSPEIGSTVNKELLNLESSSVLAFDNLESGNLSMVRMYQQYSITAVNNLALFLSEALENIKEQQKNSQSGEGDCEKPGGKSKSSMSNLKNTQMSIKQQLQKMIDEMKNGNNGQLSKNIGQMLAQQEIMQQLMREMINSGSLGSKSSDQLKLVDQLLEQSKKDLINKNITGELYNRQNLILSKLLDAEKSEIERDYEDKRESKTAVNKKSINSQEYFDFNLKSKSENEIIRNDNFRMKSFYDQKYNSFINMLKN